MVQPKYSPKEAMERVKLMMGYDLSKTLTENQTRIKPLVEQDSIDTATEKSVKKILDSCTTRPKVEGTLDAASIASAFNRAFEYWGGTDDSLWRAQKEKMAKGNFDDLCNIKREFEDLGYGNFAQALVSDLDDEELAELMEAFSAMKYRTDKEAKLAVASTEQKNINWFKSTFPCIFDSDGNVDQQVYKNANNYVYILIKGTSGKQYQVFADGRVKKPDGTSTGKKISCNGSKVTFIAESAQKKKISEQIDDSGLDGGGGQQQQQQQQTVVKKESLYKVCTDEYKKYCKSPSIKRVQECLNNSEVGDTLVPDGAWGNKTDAKLRAVAPKFKFGFSEDDIDEICGIASGQDIELGSTTGSEVGGDDIQTKSSGGDVDNANTQSSVSGQDMD
jgi:hypothetical protein